MSFTLLRDSYNADILVALRKGESISFSPEDAYTTPEPKSGAETSLELSLTQGVDKVLFDRRRKASSLPTANDGSGLYSGLP